MACAEPSIEFDNWLKKKLIDLNTDDEIFSSYIKGILESDENIEEKCEGLSEILSEISENGIEDLCSEIIKKWSAFLDLSKEAEKSHSDVEIDMKLSKLIEESKIKAPTVQVKLNSEQQKLKEAILANYSAVSDEEVSEVEETPSKDVIQGFQKNTNAENVLKASKEKRDKEKEEAQKKREKDKEDRARQKSKDEDRKEKEKKRTQKGERRR